MHMYRNKKTKLKLNPNPAFPAKKATQRNEY